MKLEVFWIVLGLAGLIAVMDSSATEISKARSMCESLGGVAIKGIDQFLCIDKSAVIKKKVMK